MTRILITGAAGNLGSLLARHLLAGGDELRLMYHRRPLPPDLLTSRIYHVGDERPVTLQRFLDEACRVWGYRPPRRLPLWLIQGAAAGCEAFATVARTPSPLTRDFIRIGRVSYCGDTTRMRQDLVARLRYPTLIEGLSTL